VLRYVGLVVLFCTVVFPASSSLSDVGASNKTFEGFQPRAGEEDRGILFRRPKSDFQDSVVEKSEELEDDNPSKESELESGKTQSREGQSVITFSGINSIVYPFSTTTSTTGNQTFLRLINPESFSNQLDVYVYSVTSFGSVLLEGVCRVNVPAKATPQLDAEYFQNCIGWLPTSLQTLMVLEFDAGDYIYWQNVVWSPSTGYFSNLSTCKESETVDDFAHSIHTSQIAAYPSVFVGYVDVASSYRITARIHNASTGALIGDYSSGIFSSGINLIELPMEQVERDATWYISTANLPFQVNLDLDVVPAFGGIFTSGSADFLGHFILQTARTETYNLSTVCLY